MMTASAGYSASPRIRAFTLVEMLVTAAVMAILGLLIVQIVAATSRAIRLSDQSTDASAQARLAFDRIGLDLSAMVRRPDADFYAGNPSLASGALASRYATASSDYLLFLSGISSAGSPDGGNRGVSLIAYRIGSHPDNDSQSCLIRAGVPIGWTDAWSKGQGFMGLKPDGFPVRLSVSDSDFPSSLMPVPPGGSAANGFDALAPGIIRMVIGFQLFPDNQPVTLADGTMPVTGGGNGQGQIVYQPPVHLLTGINGVTQEPYIDMDRISALVVGIVALDTSNLARLEAADIASIAGSFPIPSENETPVEAWTAIADGLSTTLPGANRAALQGVRVYQRAFPVTPYPARPL